MAVVLVDSSIYIDLLRRGLDPAAELLRHAETTDLAVCGMVRLEVLRGVRNLRVRDALSGFMDVMRYVRSDERLWKLTEELAWQLDRKGVLLPAQDLLIAASALSIGASVLTLDQHFDRVPRLDVLRNLTGLR